MPLKKYAPLVSWIFLAISLLYVGGHFTNRVLPDATRFLDDPSGRAFLDFDCYLGAAHNLAEGRSIYLPAEEPAPAVPCLAADLPGYVYPPTLALMMLPWTHVDPCVPERVWFAANLLACALLVPLLLVALRIPLRPGWIGLALILVGAPMATLENLALGQINLFLLAALAGSWVLLERGWNTTGTGLIVLAALLKLIPVLFGLELIRRRLWRPAAWAVAVGLGLLILSFVLTPADGPGDFLNAIGAKSNHDLISSNNASLQAGLARGLSLGDAQVKPMNIAITLLVLALALYPTLADQTSRDRRWLMALYPALCLALTPRLEAHHLVLLYPALLLLLHMAFTRSSLVSGILKTLGTVLIFIFLNSRGFTLPEFLPELLRGLLQKPAGFALWCLIFWLLIGWHRGREPQNAT